MYWIKYFKAHINDKKIINFPQDLGQSTLLSSILRKCKCNEGNNVVNIIIFILPKMFG